MAVINIQYEEPKPETYTGVKVFMKNNEVKNFDTGDFVKDWYDCTKFCMTEVMGKEHIMHSSSVNHFIMDGANFDSYYLAAVDSEVILTKKFEGIEMFVEKDKEYTWHELRKRCNDEIKDDQQSS